MKKLVAAMLVALGAIFGKRLAESLLAQAGSPSSGGIEQ